MIVTGKNVALELLNKNNKINKIYLYKGYSSQILDTSFFSSSFLFS